MMLRWICDVPAAMGSEQRPEPLLHDLVVDVEDAPLQHPHAQLAEAIHAPPSS